MINLGRHPSDMSDNEAQAYIDFMSKRYPEVKDGTLDIELIDEGSVELTLTRDAVPFQRIRRITGYLVGTTDRWNNAKTAELHDRVKHTTDS
ncbi:Anaerobic ribonucleoside-triphosphate reductase [Ruminococcus sp. YE71]|uniref:anaerobic ribonucleoside-triphosphate reductase n=1 Tax=unclassified Ruminococcus TaxID=2608920 RepID=UPI00088BC9E1|nr:MULTISPECIES: anaerobic ribonucleoside-triphosphate reductase [unclassified Ruminococcus]SDA20104.1 Anaerobic ribonucleoside-triphosphate reductase [Ruminococcus sp. YE78]SFW31825.1 Anaerobic ribonucleoside-triphosphate reductase [Ruminococcus sp. YE71]